MQRQGELFGEVFWGELDGNYGIFYRGIASSYIKEHGLKISATSLSGLVNLIPLVPENPTKKLYEVILNGKREETAEIQEREDANKEKTK